uniref:Myc box-dependent-interacting protein 1 n=1 Tax=Oryzias sinensis TaxID=183150 RepID=A0A8C7XD10_9TELE
MAEIGKGVTAGKLASNVQKRLSRAQEKVLQKLGKADETRDAAFEEMVANFNKQMTEGTKLQKDLKAYMVAVKTMHEASRRLQDCLADMYEPDWYGKEETDALAEEMIEKELDFTLEDLDTLWLEYHQNITDQSLLCVDTYLAQFPEIKARIAKRDRKMVDFDSARHHFNSLQKSKKKDEAKIAKPAALLEMAAPSWAQGLISAHQVAQTNLSYNQAEEELGRAQKIFEELNVELQDELPTLWDSRVGVYVNAFQKLANHQEKFHREMGNLTQNLHDIMTKLEEQRELNATEPTPQPVVDQCTEETQSDWNSNDATNQSCPQHSWNDAEAAEAEEAWSHDQDYAAQTYTEPSWDDDDVGQGEWGDEEVILEARANWNLIHVLIGPEVFFFFLQSFTVANGSDGELPPGFLYKVKAVHEYTATDGDELELNVGDIVLVLAFDNPDEQDDGWLLGLKESHWLQKKNISAKGVFPENFTQKV